MRDNKRLLVLANSYKYGGRCIAGRELLSDGDKYRPGNWIRPLSSREGGEFSQRELYLSSRQTVKVGDVVEIPVKAPAGDPIQPENWHIHSGTWKALSSKKPLPPLTWLEETPAHLWLDPGERCDRISARALRLRPPRQSLYLIRPENLRLQVNADGLTGQPRRRALFRYGHRDYDFHVTDPVIWETYLCRVPATHEEPLTFSLPSVDNVLLCISLTREFHEYHYKVVATIFEEVPMSDTIPPTLFSIGHSNHEMDVFLALLRRYGITAVADVRSDPCSRFNPQYNHDALQRSLEGAGIRYVFLGKELGARRSEEDCYVEDRVCYHLVAQSPQFQEGLQRLHRGMEKFRIALLCAEKDPLYCHRMILVFRSLRNQGFRLQHILEDGRVESQNEAEDRLLEELDLPLDGDLFFSRNEIIEQAYDRQGKKIAYVRRPVETVEQ